MLLICLTSANKQEPMPNAHILETCLAEIAKDNKDAFSELYQKTSVSVYGFALSILKNAQDAEDILHDCYLNIYSAAEHYRAQGKPMAWILTIAKNLCFSKLRERKKTADSSDEDWEQFLEQSPELSYEDKLFLSECMNHLSPEEREIVVLHAISGLKHREIAQLLNIPLPTVLSKYNRALKKLKKFFGKESDNVKKERD